MQTYPEKTLHKIFWLFISLHTLIWTITPVFIRHALSDDFIEAVSWGHQFAFGYDKNPWLPALTAHLGILIGGQSGIGIYFIQCLFISVGFYSVWKLMLTCSKPVYALIAVMMYEACACYSIDLQVYNDNYILMGLLPLASLYFYRCAHHNRWRDWLLAGATTALAIMAKYDAVLFALSMLLWLASLPHRLRILTSARAWTGLMLSLLIMLPNIVWLAAHQFQSLEYAFLERAGFAETSWADPLKANIKFAFEAVLEFIPTLLLAGFALLPQPKTREEAPLRHGTHDVLVFFFWAGFGPILLLLTMGFGLGLVLHREWGNTFMAFWGGFALIKWQPVVTRASLRRFIIATFAVMIILPSGYIAVSLRKDTGNWPAHDAAKIATDTWHSYFKTPLRYVAGDRYTAGYVALHSPDQPALWMEWDSRVSPWIDENDLKCHGALFIQDSGHTRQHFYAGSHFPPAVLGKFKTLKFLKPVHIEWIRNRLHKPRVILYMALLPPDRAACRNITSPAV